MRFYFLLPTGRWSSLLPDAHYMSYDRLPWSINDDAQRPRVAPDIAVEVLSPGDRPGRKWRKVETYLAHGAQLVIVLHPVKRRVVLHRADGSVEERAARGARTIEPFEWLALDWERIYRDTDMD